MVEMEQVDGLKNYLGKTIWGEKWTVCGEGWIGDKGGITQHDSWVSRLHYWMNSDHIL